MRRHDAAGIRGERSALTVPIAHSGCRKRAAIDGNVAGDIDMLTGQRRDRLDQRRKPAIAETTPQIPAHAGLLDCRCFRRANENQIADRDRTLERIDAPKPERLARRQVQPVTTYRCGRRQS